MNVYTMRIIMTLRRNRTSLLLINYIIMATIFLYLLVIGYQGSSIEIRYSKACASAREKGATDEEINQINAEHDEAAEPYIYKYKVVAAILLPITLFTIGLCNLGPIAQIVVEVEHVELVVAHSEPAPVPVAKLVEIDIETGTINPCGLKNKS
jgi:hypothetical protein